MEIERVRDESSSEEQMWYALRVRSNFERLTATHLENRGYAPFLPVYRSRRAWSDRLKEIDLPLLPGYVFCQLDIHKRLPVLSTPGVVSIVGAGKRPIPVETEEIAALRAISSSDRPAEPWPFLRSGQQVRIVRGPFEGTEGILIQTRKCYRIVVSVTLLQRSVSVEIDRDWVVPVKSALLGFAQVAGRA